ncbi:MAG: hypothetical protein K9I74_13175, partial [Bacteroidales bacterium]|nr:hypothetical protein [Bacteroidales bacterium]
RFQNAYEPFFAFLTQNKNLCFSNKAYLSRCKRQEILARDAIARQLEGRVRRSVLASPSSFFRPLA